MHAPAPLVPASASEAPLERELPALAPAGVDAVKLDRAPQSSPAGLSVQRRVVRADALLRSRSPRAVGEARVLLEGVLPEVPADAHARAGLAHACLRLHDAACARGAIGEALRLRPRRSRYVALAREIARAFPHP